MEVGRVDRDLVRRTPSALVHLKDGSDVYGDPEDGFTITVSEHDEYGDANYWADNLAR